MALRIGGHPVHPALVHFPIALWTVSVAADVAVAAGFALDPVFAYATLVAGLAFSALALLAGFVDYALLRSDHPAQSTATWHMTFMTAAAGLFLVSAWLRGGPVAPPTAALGCSVAGWLVLLAGGWLGGTLVYRYGVAVETAEGSSRSRPPRPGA